MNTPETAVPSPKRQRRKLLIGAVLATALFCVLAAVVGFVSGYVDGYSERRAGIAPIAELFDGTPLAFWTIAGVTAIGQMYGMWWAARWWASIDEAAQRAHLDSFFWGASWVLAASSTIILGSLLVPEFAFAPLEALPGTKTHAAAVGAIGFAAAIMVGYGLGWLFWWWKRR
jgi:hypothetical protein